MKQRPPAQITEKVWWLGSSRPEDFLQTNSFAVSTPSGFLLIDPGPSQGFPEIREAFFRATGKDLPAAIAVTSQNADTCASINSWEEIGFAGPIICHWRGWMHLGAYGIRSPAEGIHQAQTSRHVNMPGIRFIPAPVFNTVGSLFIFEEDTRTFFSGPYCGAVGRSFPLYAGEGYAPALSRSLTMNLSRADDVETVFSAIEGVNPLVICPHHGSILSGDWGSLFGKLRKMNMEENAVELRNFLLAGAIAPEGPERSLLIDDLRKENEKLQEALVLGSDELMKDPVTGLYTRKYLDAYLSVFLTTSPQGSVAAIHLDSLRSLAIDIGGDEAERAMQTFARNVLAMRPDDFLVFRGSGASLILLAASESAMLPFIARLQEEIPASSSFLKSSTVSAAVVYCSEVHTPGSISSMLERRVEALESMGPGSICSHTPDFRARSPGPVLIVEPDRALARLMFEYLSARRHTVLFCHSGDEAMRIIDERQPAVIICEQHVPQYDGYFLYAYAKRAVKLLHPRFILLSSHKTEEDVSRACAAGITHFIKKPLMLAEIEGLTALLLEEAYAFWD